MTPSTDDLMLVILWWVLLPCLAMLMVAGLVELWRRRQRRRLARDRQIVLTQARRQLLEHLAADRDQTSDEVR